MPIKHSLWSVSTPPRQLSEGQLPSELMLHQMIKAAPELLSPDWMLIGSEVPSTVVGWTCWPWPQMARWCSSS